MVRGASCLLSAVEREGGRGGGEEVGWLVRGQLPPECGGEGGGGKGRGGGEVRCLVGRGV